MKPGLVVVIVLSSLSAFAQQVPIVTVKGQLVAEGQPVLQQAHFVFAPAESSTALAMDVSGSFELKAMTSRRYAVTVNAAGYAPSTSTVEVDPGGVIDAGVLKLFKYKRFLLEVVLGHQKALAAMKSSQVVLAADSCVSIRADDDSGCHVRLCARQDTDVVTVQRWADAATLNLQGESTLRDAMSGAVAVSQDRSDAVRLVPGEAVRMDFQDTWCAGAFRTVRELPEK